jgi:hypothetical protein
MRRRLAWLAALPAMLAGTEAAHAFAYRLVFPQDEVRLHVLALTGHGYLAWLPLVLGASGAVALVGLAAAVLDAARGRTVRELPAWAFGLLPPCAFALQELLELSLHTGTFAWHAFAEPTFLPGLVLQLPFALLAYLCARLLLRAAVRLGAALSRPRRLAPTLLVRHCCNQIATWLQSDCTWSPRGPPHVVAI